MRPIDADATKKDFGEHFGDVQDAVCAQQIIDRQPTIDRESLIPHGHWFDRGSLSRRCSHCGCKSPRETTFCQHCNDNGKITGEGGAHDFRIIGNAIYYYDPNFGWEGAKINYCPWCGRKLQENSNETD